MSAIASLLRKIWPSVEKATPVVGAAIATGALGLDPQTICLALASASMLGVDFMMDRESGRKTEEVRKSLLEAAQKSGRFAQQVMYEQPQLNADLAPGDPVLFERVLFRWLQGEFRQARDLQLAIHDQLESATRFFDNHPTAWQQFVETLSTRIDQLDHDLQQLVRESTAQLGAGIKLVHSDTTEILDIVRQLPQSLPLGPVGPAILPPCPPVVVGRDSQIAEFVAAVTADSPPPVAILGHPGIGKSTVSLAGAHAESVQRRFGDWRIFVRCDGAESVESLTKLIAIGLGCGESSDPLRSVLASLEAHPTLLILDNFETPWTADAERVEELLRHLIGVRSTALVVSVRGPKIPLVEMRAIEPQLLSVEQSREAFCRHANGFRQDADLATLVDPLEGVPFPIYLLARSARGRLTLADVVTERNELRTGAFATETLSTDPARRRLQDLAFSFELSLKLGKIDASPAARALLAALSLVPDGAAPDHLRTVFPGGESTRAEQKLIDLGLIYIGARGRLRMLAPLREYLRGRLKTEVQARSRIAEFYLALAEEYGEKPGAEGGAEAVAILTPEAGNIESLMEHLLSGNARDPETQRRLIQAAIHFAEFQRITGWGTAQLLVRTEGVAREIGDDMLQATCIKSLGNIALGRSDHAEAGRRYAEALPLYQRVGDVLGEANCIKSLGNIALRRSDHAEAENQYLAALQLYQRIPEPYSMGWTHIRLSQFAATPEDRSQHLAAARTAWLSIDRADLVEQHLSDE